MNEKRTWIEQQISQANTLPIESATDILDKLSPFYMEELVKDISITLGVINPTCVPWIIASLEIYAEDLRQIMPSSGQALADKLKCLPRETIRIEIPTK